jgi:very-short-patch-repair endonuclease
MTTDKARRLRKNLTDAERTVWNSLRSRQFGGYKFRRQQPIGPYIVDFVCFENKLIIELDGGHHDHSQQADYDSVRTAWLEVQGYRVLRFWNNQVMEEPDAVKATILEALEQLHV